MHDIKNKKISSTLNVFTQKFILSICAINVAIYASIQYQAAFKKFCIQEFANFLAQMISLQISIFWLYNGNKEPWNSIFANT